ncbi:hypothetical protein NA57DRAFT_36575 [Rhizodiscina lignyota]|uniref:NIMA interactive protein n=1 Tax=Rhizodiscina lignyota TaxID=1504668 RepID=A0A9P4MAF2_9PEZI|nr:hypothetical protein NA57DRAFT_36575 [Rhizodiscina lignyota]
MDSFSLKTASTYVNNLLLARGLLRNGKPLEFAKPSKGEGGTEATMAQVINIIHDLILRRDREQEQRETLVQTIRSLRTDATRNTSTTERLEAKTEDLTRQLSLSQSQERAAKVALRTAEASAKALREEMLRLKTTVQQVRTSCANDVRKRDVQIQKLKMHLNSQQRGNKTGLVGASITITPGVTGVGGALGALREEDGPDVHDPAYTLNQETTEFLTELSQGLSEENDSLIGLVRSTLATLRELQGLPGNAQRVEGSDTSQQADEANNSSDMVRALPTSYEALATDMDSVLENLKSLLTNPNFVPIDEVTVREEEIARLRAGFERLEGQWHEAIVLMNGWRERMVNGGDTVNLEELKIGLGLGAGLGTYMAANRDADGSKLEGIAEESEEVDDLDLDSAAEDDDIPPESSPNVLQPVRDVTKTGASKELRHPPLQEAAGNSSSPKKALKRNSSAERDDDEPSPKLTVQEKLDAVQAEAEEAAVTVVEKESKSASKDQIGDQSGGAREGVRSGSPRKTRIGGRPRRRKSTLTRDELAEMLVGLI